jgi:hypothetical protein
LMSAIVTPSIGGRRGQGGREVDREGRVRGGRFVQVACKLESHPPPVRSQGVKLLR